MGIDDRPWNRKREVDMKIGVRLVCLMFVLQACGQQIPLTEEELALIPYKGNETLTFKSNLGERDTIQLKDLRFGYHDGPERLRYYGQVATIYGDFSDPNPPSGKHRYVYGHVFSIDAATPESETMVGIHVSAKNAHFYGPNNFKLTQFDSIPQIKMKIKDSVLLDVLVINADTTKKRNYYYYKTRRNFITTVYWSRSEGVVKYVKKDGEVWTKDN